MNCLVVLNNHNSFGILDLCLDLQRVDPSVAIKTVSTPEFAAGNEENFKKRGLEPSFLEPRTGSGAAVSSRMIAGAKALEERTRTTRQGTGAWSRLKDTCLGLVVNSSAYAMAREWRVVRRLSEKKRQALELFEQFKPDVVLSLSDRSHDYVEGPVLWAARTTKTPIVLPYVAQFDIDSAVAYRRDAKGRVMSELCPFQPFSFYKLWSYVRLRHQIYRGIFFQAPFILNASKRSSILSRYPWWTGNGLSDVVCVDSEHTRLQYERHQVPKEKIAVLGHVQYDRVFISHQQRSSIRQALRRQYSLDEEKALLILSMPQYAEQGYVSWEEHWQDINAIVGNISEAGQNLLLSVHPRSDVSQYRYLEQAFGCRILTQPLADVIGAADVFLASNSSTFVWSALCGIPAVAVKSPVRFLYEHLTSVLQVDDSQQLTASIKSLLSGPAIDFSHDWDLLSRGLVFDGKYKDRFRLLLEQNARPDADGTIIH